MERITIKEESTGITLFAALNDTVAAKDLAKRLPCTFSGSDSGIDFCCTASSGNYDPAETQTGWKNGDISLGGGWFAVLYGGEEQSAAYTDMMIVGHLEQDSLSKVPLLPKRVKFTLDFA